MPDYQVVKNGKIVTLKNDKKCSVCGAMYCIRPGWDNHFICSNACCDKKRENAK